MSRQKPRVRISRLGFSNSFEGEENFFITSFQQRDEVFLLPSTNFPEGKMSELVLVTGGVRSGKSSYAQTIAEVSGAKVF